jgi:small subunit ribosomal protein S6
MKYEVLTLLKPENSEEQIDSIIEKIKENIETIKGKFLEAEKWGKRSLQYTFKKKNDITEAFFVLIHFEKEQGDLIKLDYNLKINDNVLRHMITKKGL